MKVSRGFKPLSFGGAVVLAALLTGCVTPYGGYVGEGVVYGPAYAGPSYGYDYGDAGGFGIYGPTYYGGYSPYYGGSYYRGPVVVHAPDRHDVHDWHRGSPSNWHHTDYRGDHPAGSPSHAPSRSWRGGGSHGWHHGDRR